MYLRTLEQCRFMWDMTFIYKVLNNYIHCTKILKLFKLPVPPRILRRLSIFHLNSYKTFSKGIVINGLCKSANKVELVVYFSPDPLYLPYTYLACKFSIINSKLYYVLFKCALYTVYHSCLYHRVVPVNKNYYYYYYYFYWRGTHVILYSCTRVRQMATAV